MALDATVGASTSNSYVTQAEATAYLAAGMHPDNATWVALSSNGMDELLILSTFIIDQQHIDGQKNDVTLTSGAPDQRLKFPRTMDVDAGSEFIPLAVKEATYEQAIAMAKGGTASSITDLQNQGVTAVSLADMSYTFGGQGRDTELSERATLLLAPYIKQAGGA